LLNVRFARIEARREESFNVILKRCVAYG
jgi:hypothetical protein